MPEIPDGMMEVATEVATVLRAFESHAMGDLMDASRASHELGAGVGQGVIAVAEVWTMVALSIGWGPIEAQAMLDLLAAVFSRNLGAAGMGPDDL